MFYDSGYVDGFESVFTTQVLENLTPETLHALIESDPTAQQGQTVGKLVYGYEWYLALELSPSIAAGFVLNREYQFTFPENNDALDEWLVGEDEYAGWSILPSRDSKNV